MAKFLSLFTLLFYVGAQAQIVKHAGFNLANQPELRFSPAVIQVEVLDPDTFEKTEPPRTISINLNSPKLNYLMWNSYSILIDEKNKENPSSRSVIGAIITPFEILTDIGDKIKIEPSLEKPIFIYGVIDLIEGKKEYRLQFGWELNSHENELFYIIPDGFEGLD